MNPTINTKYENKAKYPYRLIATLCFSLGATLFFAYAPVTSYAAPGDLDQTFGNGGKVVRGTNVMGFAAPGDLDQSFGSSGKVTDWSGSVRGVAIQPDGKIVVAGIPDSEASAFDFRISRYNGDGNPDLTFGGGTGRVTTDFGSYDFANSVMILPDGRILVVGTSGDSSLNQGGIALARYHSNGILDTSFGGGSGKVRTLLPCWYAPYGSVGNVVILPNGMIVGSVGMGSDDNCQNHGLLVRYHSNGLLDTSFGNNGTVFTEHPLFFIGYEPLHGRVWAGTYGPGFSGIDRIVPFTSNGSPLPGNAAVVPSGYSLSGHSVSFDHEGKIVAAGYAYQSPDFVFAIFRFNSNGTPDKSFDGDGIVTTSFGSGDSFASSVVIEKDGKIVAAGTHSLPGSAAESDFALARYNSNGSLDTMFGGGDGLATVDFGNLSDDEASDIALDGDGRAVVVGGSNRLFAIARFLLAPGSIVPDRTAFDFDGDGRSDVSVLRPSEGNWYLDRSTNGFSATQFGLSTDKITPADFDGDGATDIAVYRDGTWYWLNSGTASFSAYQFGIASDAPVPGDYTGDGRDELAVFRGGQWWTFDLTNIEPLLVNFGSPGDRPVPADYDGDGSVDQAVYRNGDWHLSRSGLGHTTVSFGLPSDRPVVGDYDGDSKADISVYRDGTWYLLRSMDGFAAIQWGLPTDTPVPADYDGDGRTDVAVYRDGFWYLRQSTGGFSVQQFGLPNDRPVPSVFLQ